MKGLGVLAPLAACAPTEPGPLTDPTQWVQRSAGGDPFPAHARAYEGCDFAEGGSFYEEAGVLEIDTGVCGYLVLEQPTLRAVAAGDLVEWTISHSDLLAEAPAEAHVAIALGDDVLWSWTTPIPTLSEVLVQRAAAPGRAPEGTSVRIHLHNHGDNRWRFLDDRIEPR